MRDKMLTMGNLSEGRHNNFDALRFILASLVIFSHSFVLASGSKLTEPFFRLDSGQAEGGAIAVDGFFIISGFLVTQSWMRSRGALDYFRKRILRIYPGFAVALAFCVFIVGPLGGAVLPGYLRDPHTYRYFKQLLLSFQPGLPHVFLNNPYPVAVNGSLWTIPIEIECYLLVALLGLLGVYRRREFVLAVFLGFFAFYVCEPHLHITHFRALLAREYLPRLAMCFMAGSAFYHYRDSIPHSRGLLALSLAVVALSFKAGLALTLPVCGAYILFYLAYAAGFKAQNFGRRGDISYGTYLYAFPVQQLVLYYCAGHMGPWILFFISAPVTYLLAALSWFIVEAPFMRLKRRTQPIPVVEAAPEPVAIT